jgi:hypothetical protein
MLMLVIRSEENRENIRALEGGHCHWHLKKAYIGNSLSGKSREYQGLRGKPFSLAFGRLFICPLRLIKSVSSVNIMIIFFNC